MYVRANDAQDWNNIVRSCRLLKLGNNEECQQKGIDYVDSYRALITSNF
jgi:hypothetical protein